MKCSNCKSKLERKLVQCGDSHVSCNICGSCGSLWLTGGELEVMIFDSEKMLVKAMDSNYKGLNEAKRKCLDCDNVIMDKVKFKGYDGIVMDLCGNCGGLWLDAADLESMDQKTGKVIPESYGKLSEFVNNVHIPNRRRLKRTKANIEKGAERIPLEGAKLKGDTDCFCPACGAGLKKYTIFRIQIDGCSKCGGIWLDKNELRALKDNVNKGLWITLRWMDDEVESSGKSNAIVSSRNCPKCEEVKLLSTNFGDSSVIIDWCPSCAGTWLDFSEFNDLTQFLKDKLANLTPQEMKEKVYEEIKEIWNHPESVISEILDAKAAISALINITIYEHPSLAKRLLNFSETVAKAGLT